MKALFLILLFSFTLVSCGKYGKLYKTNEEKQQKEIDKQISGNYQDYYNNLNNLDL